MSAPWPVVPLRRVAEVRGGITKGRDLEGKHIEEYPYLRVANVQDGHVVLDQITTIPATAAEAVRYALRAGDVLMNEGGDADKLGRGCVWHGEINPCLHQNHVFCVRPQPALAPQWLNYVTSSEPAKYYFQAKAKQTTGIASISSTNLKGLPVSLPPLPTQRTIADFLDRKTAAIDALIEKKERLVALLAEQRAALIHRAVTRGLDPDVEMKDSGVEWIGEVPAHWAVAKVSYRYEQQLGKMLNPEASTGMEQAPYLGNKDVQWDHVDVSNLNTMSFSPSERLKFSLRTGDLLVCEGGIVGRTAVWRSEIDKCYFQKAIHRLRTLRDDQDHPRYFFYCMTTATQRGVFEKHGNKSTIGHLTGEALRAHKFVLPPLTEQVAIATYLDDTSGNNQRLQDVATRQIDRLREYRQTLITAAVTGQLDIPTDEPSP